MKIWSKVKLVKRHFLLKVFNLLAILESLIIHILLTTHTPQKHWDSDPGVSQMNAPAPLTQSKHSNFSCLRMLPETAITHYLNYNITPCWTNPGSTNHSNNFCYNLKIPQNKEIQLCKEWRDVLLNDIHTLLNKLALLYSFIYYHVASVCQTFNSILDLFLIMYIMLKDVNVCQNMLSYKVIIQYDNKRTKIISVFFSFFISDTAGIHIICITH